ncbi:sugar phosphate isomerase/epimerase [Victivallales bacterium CCUG 44730]|nr:sugar phosphate isomerase/epimerase [Victivallales bacterium CCUG 44730]
MSMKQAKIAAQLYSFRDYIGTPAGVRDTLRRLRRTGYEAVQLSGAIAPMPEAELRRMLREEGMAAPTSHERAAELVGEPERVIDRLLALDCRHTACPYPQRVPTGAGETVAFAEELNRAAEKFRRAGIVFAYHNHSIEFRRFGGRPMLEIIYENAPLVDGEPDTFWIQKGGGDPAAWIERLSGRLRVLHVKDFGVNPSGEPVMMPVGSGNLDWKRIFAAAEAAGVEYYVVEHDGDCADPFESFAASMRFLKGNFVS